VHRKTEVGGCPSYVEVLECLLVTVNGGIPPSGDGRKRAMAADAKFGRKRKLSNFQRAEAIKRRNAGERLADIAKSYAVDISMISRLQP
jgi:hypothetical protein